MSNVTTLDNGNITVTDKLSVDQKKREADKARIESVAKALSKFVRETLPQKHHYEVSGFAQAYGAIGSTTKDGNALVKMLKNQFPYEYAWYANNFDRDVKLSTDWRGLNLELGDFKATVELPTAVKTFADNLCYGDYPKLVEKTKTTW